MRWWDRRRLLETEQFVGSTGDADPNAPQEGLNQFTSVAIPAPIWLPSLVPQLGLVGGEGLA